MRSTEERLGMICTIVKENNGIGKTALMKLIYILQQVYKVPLGYNYSIYTYGPYSAEVMNGIDFAEQSGLISIEIVPIGLSCTGYKLEHRDKADEAIKDVDGSLSKYKEMIREAIGAFGQKNAKELELTTTIIYAYANYYDKVRESGDVDERIIEIVSKIKPLFQRDSIRQEYKALKDNGMLAKALPISFSLEPTA